MPEEERAAEQEQEEFKLRSCKHKNCKSTVRPAGTHTACTTATMLL